MPGKKRTNRRIRGPRNTSLRRKERAPRNTCRALVLIDQEPLRRKALQGCRRAMKQLDKARAEWSAYDKVDRPAFERWYHKSLGSLLTRLRDERTLLAEKQHLVEEVEFELTFGSARSPREAYRHVMHRRQFPEEKAKEDFEDFDAEDDEAEEEDAFKSYFRNVFGFDEEEVDEMYREYRKTQYTSSSNGAQDRSHQNAPIDEAEGHLVSRVKDRYRLLARRLHPDMLSADDTRKQGLWHEVQEAYRACDLDRLDTIIALCEVEDGQVTEGTAISQLEGVRDQFKASLRALRAELRRAKKSPAWSFSNRTDLSELKAEFEEEITESLEDTLQERRALEKMIAAWSRPIEFGSPPARRKSQKNPRSQRTHANPNQTEFAFG